MQALKSIEHAYGVAKLEYFLLRACSPSAKEALHAAAT